MAGRFTKKFTWNEASLEELYSLIISYSLQQWENDDGNIVATTIAEFKKIFPECRELRQNFKIKVKRILERRERGEISPKKERKVKSVTWTEEIQRKLLDLAEEVERENKALQYTGKYAGKRGPKSSFFKILTEKVKNELDIDVSEGAVKNALKRAKTNFEHDIVPDIILKPVDDESEQERMLLRAWQAAHGFASNPLFDACCGDCGCLLYGPLRDGHKFVRNSSEAPILLHYSEDRLLPFRLDKDKIYVCRTCFNNPLGSIRTIFPYYNPENNSGEYPLSILAHGKLTTREYYYVALVCFDMQVMRSAIPQAGIFVIGQAIGMRHKSESYIHAFYAFLSSKKVDDKVNSERVVHVLRWLKRNNPLYLKFFANYETLYRYYDCKTNFPLFGTSFKEVVGEEFDYGSEEELLHVPIDLEVPSALRPDEYYDAIEHHRENPRFKDICTKNVLNTTRSSHWDVNLENKAFPLLYPYGCGGWSRGKGITCAQFSKIRLFSIDDRWRRCVPWVFEKHNRIAQESYYYCERNYIKKTENLENELTVQDILNNQNDPFERHGIPIKSNIKGSLEYFRSQTYNLIALGNHMARNPDLFVTITFNDLVPEMQAFLFGGAKCIPKLADSFLDQNFPQKKEYASLHPFEASVAFQKRFRFLFRYIREHKVFGEIEAYFIRTEYQNRGAPHKHMVFWIKPGTLPADVVCAELPRGNDPVSLKLRELVERVNIHKCKRLRCNFEGKRELKKCKFEFPFSVNDKLKLAPNRKRFHYIRRDPEDHSVVPYNKTLLVLAQAHCNVQLVTSEGWKTYIVSYTTKLGKSYRVQYDRQQKLKDARKFIRMRDVPINECCDDLAGYKMIECSHDCIFLPTDFVPNYRMLKMKKDMSRLPGDSKDLYVVNKLFRYMDRSKSLEKVCYSDLYRKYIFDYKLGDFRLRVRHEACVRWKFISADDDFKEFCLQFLVLNIPFRKMEDLFSPENINQNPIKECMFRSNSDPRFNFKNKKDFALKFLDSARSKLFSSSKIQELALDLFNRGYLDKDDFNLYIEGLEFDELDVEPDVEKEAEDLEVLIEEYKETLKNLTSDQRRTVESILADIEDKKQVLAFITGGGGVGKSYVVRVLERYLKARRITHAILATTGIAAKNIGGQTIHSFFRLNIHSHFNLDRGSIEADLIRETEVIFIDEVSMLDLEVFLKVEVILRSFQNRDNYSSNVFGNRHIILIGDPAQLPVVKSESIWDHALFLKFKIFNLKEVMRQKGDDRFIRLMNRVRRGIVDSEVNSYFVQKFDRKCLDSFGKFDSIYETFITPKAKSRDDFNSFILKNLSGNIHSFEALDIEESGKSIDPLKADKLAYIAKCPFKKVLNLKLNCRVILLKNIDSMRGWVNGTIARVVEIGIDSICIADINNSSRLKVITRAKMTIGRETSLVKSYRHQFPLDLAYALTIHKTQGLTLNKVVIDLNDCWESGQAYVAISRVKDPKCLRFISYDKEKIILNDHFRDILSWIDKVDELVVDKDFERPPFPFESECKSDLKEFVCEENEKVVENLEILCDDSDSDTEIGSEIGLTSGESDILMFSQKDENSDDDCEDVPMLSQGNVSVSSFDNDFSFGEINLSQKSMKDDENENNLCARVQNGDFDNNLLFQIDSLCERVLQDLVRVSEELEDDGEILAYFLNLLEQDGMRDLFNSVKFLMSANELKLFSEIPSKTTNSGVIRKCRTFPKAFLEKFKAVEVRGDGNCLYYSIAMNLFGVNGLGFLVRLGCVGALVRNYEFIQRMSGCSVKEIMWQVSKDREYGSDVCYTLASIACNRPFYCFSLENFGNYNPSVNLVGLREFSIHDLNEHINQDDSSNVLFGRFYLSHTPFTSEEFLSRQAIQVYFYSAHYNAIVLTERSDDTLSIRPRIGIFNHRLTDDAQELESNVMNVFRNE